jgi:hypothetical protein
MNEDDQQQPDMINQRYGRTSQTSTYYNPYEKHFQSEDTRDYSQAE